MKCNGKLMDPSVIEATPIGRESAMSALDIWKVMKCWAPVSVRQRLFVLAQEGKLHMANEPKRGQVARYVYWKDGVVV